MAVMADPLVQPSTRTGSLFVTALADDELLSFWYVVKAASVTVTFWFPAVVVMVKLDEDTLLTVPAAPPGAGPDRAFDPVPLDPEQLPELLPDADAEGDAFADVTAVFEVDAAVAEGDVARPTESPITAHISAAATIHPLPLFDSNRRRLGRRG